MWKLRKVSLCSKVRCHILTRALDDMIKILKSMIATSSDIEEALNRVLQETDQQYVHRQEFMTAIASFQTSLLQDLEKSRLEAESYFAKLLKSIDFTMKNLMSKVSSAVKAAETEITGLSEVSGDMFVIT